MKSKKTVKRVFNILLWIVVVLMVALAAALFAGRMTNNPVFIFGKSFVWIVSNSMEPDIEAQSFILVEKADGSSVGVGDVIMFRSENPDLKGGFNTHELIEISDDGKAFVTKGKNNRVDDGVYSAKPENVVGKYVKTLPTLTALMRFFSKPAGLITFFALFLILIAAVFVPDMVKSSKKKKEEELRKIEEEKKRLIDEEIARLKAENKDNSNQ